MKQITTRLYTCHTVSDEQLERLKPNLIIILNSGQEGKIEEFCSSRGFITKNHDIFRVSEKELDSYVQLTKMVFGMGDKILIISNDSSTMNKYVALLLMSTTGMMLEDANNLVRGKIG